MSNDVTIKLRGDKSDLDRALNDAQSGIADFAGYVKGALVGIAAGIAVKELFDFGMSAVNAAAEAEVAQARLGSVLRATGEAAGFTQDQMNQLAADMHDLTGIGDDTITGMQAVLATFRNIKGEEFKQATVAAADMAAVLGGDLEGAAMQLGKALNDPVKGITALTRSGVSFTDSQKETINTMMNLGDVAGAQKIILEELANEFGGAAADKAKTFQGRVDALWDSLGEMQEGIGNLLIPALEALLPMAEAATTFFENLIGSLSDSSAASEEFADNWSEYFVETFKWGVYVATDAFSLLEFLFNNFSNIVERETYSWMLSFVTTFEELKYQLTEVAPQYLEWFAENFSNILTDIAKFQAVVFTNMWKNVFEFFTSLQDYLSGNGGSFEFVALTEGFEATTKALPEIAARQKSEMERQLEGNIKQMDTMMGKSLMDTFAKNREMVDAAFKPKDKKEKVDVVANTVPYEVDVAKAKEKAEKKPLKVKVDEPKIDLKNPEPIKKPEEKEAPATLGAVTSIEELGKSIQAAAFKDTSNSASQQMMPEPVGVFNAGLMMNEIDELIKNAPNESKPGEIKVDSPDDKPAVETTKLAIAAGETEKMDRTFDVSEPKETKQSERISGGATLADVVGAIKQLLDFEINNQSAVLQALQQAGGVI